MLKRKGLARSWRWTRSRKNTSLLSEETADELLLRFFQPFPLSGFADRPRQLVRLQRLFKGAFGLSGHERIDLSLERIVVGERVHFDWRA